MKNTTKKKYLITGGLGMIGSELANKLDGQICVLAPSKKNKDQITRKDTKFLIKDIKNITLGDLKEIDCVYHCASTLHNYHVLTDPYIDTETNIKGTIHLLELIKDLPKKPHLIFPSTTNVYGNEYDRTGEPINEESKVNPLGLYPITKLCAEQIIELYSRLYDIPYSICRITNVYSLIESIDDPKKAWLNFFIMNTVKGKPTKIYDGGNFVRDYIFIDDVIDALMFVEKLEQNDTFLIGYGKSVKFKDLIDYVLENTGNKARVGKMEPPAFHKAVGVKNFVANTEKINKLGWKAKVDYKEGLQKVIDHYKSLQI